MERLTYQGSVSALLKLSAADYQKGNVCRYTTNTTVTAPTVAQR